MTEEEFADLFHQALERAVENAEHRLARPIPRRFAVTVFGAGYSGVIMSPEQAVRVLYLGPDRYYRIIDVAVVAVEQDRCTAFVRISGHAPGSFDETWNDPPGAGPFKQILAQEIKVE